MGIIKGRAILYQESRDSYRGGVERAEQRFGIGDTCHSRAAGWNEINCICRASDFLLPL